MNSMQLANGGDHSISIDLFADGTDWTSAAFKIPAESFALLLSKI